MKKISTYMLVWMLLALLIVPAFAEDSEIISVVETEVVEVPAPEAPEAPEMPAIEPLDPEKVLAIVNGTEIKGVDVQEIVDMFLAQVGGNIPAAQLGSIIEPVRARALEELIMREVMFSEAKKQNVTLSDEEFAEVMDELANSLPPGVTIEEMMEQSGSSEEELRNQMLIRKMIMTRAESAGEATEEEVRAFYDENLEMFQEGDTIVASHILLRTDNVSPEEKAAKREKIEALRKELLDGADFAELARENSDCPSAATGGELGPFGRGVMVKAFEDAAFGQEIEAIGDVVETPFGYHLIRVTEKRDARTIPFEEVSELISERLTVEKQSEVVNGYLEELHENADIQRFDDAAEEAEIEG